MQRRIGVLVGRQAARFSRAPAADPAAGTAKIAAVSALRAAAAIRPRAALLSRMQRRALSGGFADARPAVTMFSDDEEVRCGDAQPPFCMHARRALTAIPPCMPTSSASRRRSAQPPLCMHARRALTAVPPCAGAACPRRALLEGCSGSQGGKDGRARVSGNDAKDAKTRAHACDAHTLACTHARASTHKHTHTHTRTHASLAKQRQVRRRRVRLHAPVPLGC